MNVIDFTEAKLRHLIHEFTLVGDSYGSWAMEEILQMYLEKEVKIFWEDGFPIPHLSLDNEH